MATLTPVLFLPDSGKCSAHALLTKAVKDAQATMDMFLVATGVVHLLRLQLLRLGVRPTPNSVSTDNQREPDPKLYYLLCIYARVSTEAAREDGHSSGHRR